MALPLDATIDSESLFQSDFLRDLRKSDIECVPSDTTDLILDAYENDEFWLHSSSHAVPVPVQHYPNNLERKAVAFHLGHAGTSSVAITRSPDTLAQVEIRTNLEHIPTEAPVAMNLPHCLVNVNMEKQGQRTKKARTSRSRKQLETKGKRRKSTNASAIVLPLSAYNYFFRVERIRLLEAASDTLYSESSQSSNALCFYAHILSGSSREFQDMVLRDQWERDPNQKRKHRKSHGRIPFRTLARLISLSWQHLPEECKQIFYTISARDFQRYESESGKTVLRG